MSLLTKFYLTLLLIYMLIGQYTCDNSPTFHDLTNILINDDHDVNSTVLNKNNNNGSTESSTFSINNNNATNNQLFDLSNHITIDNSTNHTSHHNTHASPAHTTSIDHHQSESKCELITLPMCKGIGYNHTRMPNQLNHDTQEEAGLEGKFFYKNTAF